MSAALELSVSEYLAGLGAGFRFSRAPQPCKGEPNAKRKLASWIGGLDVEQFKLTVLLQISNWDFTTLPQLYVQLPLPTHLNSLLPLAHLGPDFVEWNGKRYLLFCYSLNDAYELTRRDPVRIVEWILFGKAKMVLQRLFADNKFRQTELLREVEPCWNALFLLEYQKSLGDIFNEDSRQKNSILCFYRLLFTSSIAACVSPIVLEGLSKQKLKWESLLSTDHAATEFTTTVLAITPQQEYNMPSLKPFLDELQNQSMRGIGLAIFCRWLRAWDIRLAGRFVDDFLGNWDYKIQLANDLYVGCLIIQGQPLAFSVLFSGIQSKKISKSRLKKELSGSTLVKYSDRARVFWHPSVNLSPEFIYRRSLNNMNQLSLEGKKIALIGCGAIGGYLALSLARLGAGVLGGTLCLIDPDDMGTQNLGRHALGMGAVGQKKAIALKSELERQLPALTITPINKSVLEDTVLTQIQGYDLIIDATAKMTVSEALNERYHAWPIETRPALLHVWIRANGECVQGLLVEPASKYACRSCLQQAGYAIGAEHNAMPNHQAKTAFLACADYTPYAVSAGMSAAALACDMTLDWVSSRPAPHYRTRYGERWQGEKIQSMDINASPTCHICANQVDHVD